MPVIVGVHGPSGSGKTTLIEELIPRLKARGITVGVIKHAHEGLTLDTKGKDSWRLWQAGAEAVLVAAPQETMLRTRGSASLESLLTRLPEHVDCLFVEGFGGNDHMDLRFGIPTTAGTAERAIVKRLKIAMAR